MADSPDILDTLSDQDLADEIRARREQGQTPIVITKAGSTGPAGDFGPLQPLPQTDPSTMAFLQAQAAKESAAQQRQYQDQVDLGNDWRQNNELLGLGINPNRLLNQRQATPTLDILKSGNDIFGIDRRTGIPTKLVSAPPAAVKPTNPYVSPIDIQNLRATNARDLENLRAAHEAAKQAQTRFQKLSDDPNTASDVLMNAGLDVKDAQDRLDGFKATPAAPNLLGGNTIPLVPSAVAAPQVNGVVRTLKDGRKAIFNPDTKAFIRYAD